MFHAKKDAVAVNPAIKTSMSEVNPTLNVPTLLPTTKPMEILHTPHRTFAIGEKKILSNFDSFKDFFLKGDFSGNFLPDVPFTIWGIELAMNAPEIK